MSPAAIRSPKYEHYHFRMQMIIDGEAVNFAKPAYQEGYSKDNCNVALTKHPIHFHDKRDQMVHIHWDGMTGGMVLKYYGWDYIGGAKGVLGYRFDTFPKLTPVSVHIEKSAMPAGDKFYVYSGDEQSFKVRSWQAFLHQDLEKFFNKKSNVSQKQTSSLLDKLFPKALAHAGHEHTDAELFTNINDTQDPETLKDINNLLGNVVIFAQKEKPTDAQVKARFQKLVPLTSSTCGG